MLRFEKQKRPIFGHGLRGRRWIFPGIRWNLFNSLTLSFRRSTVGLCLCRSAASFHSSHRHPPKKYLVSEVFCSCAYVFRTLAQAQLNCSFNIQHFNVKAMKSNKGLNTQRKIKRKSGKLNLPFALTLFLRRLRSMGVRVRVLFLLFFVFFLLLRIRFVRALSFAFF